MSQASAQATSTSEQRAQRVAISALGEMRGTVGVHVAKIANEFKLDIEDRLASILPANAEVDSGDDDRRPARRSRPR